MKVKFSTVLDKRTSPEGKLCIDWGTEFTNCCDDAKYAYSGNFLNLCVVNENVAITIPEPYWYRSYDLKDEDEIGIKRKPIQFCPFCGSFIELVETKRTMREEIVVQKTVSVRELKDTIISGDAK